MARKPMSRYQVITFRLPGLPEPISGFIETLTRNSLVIVYAKGAGLKQLRNTEGQLPADLLAQVDAQPHDRATVIPPALQAHIDSRIASTTFAKGDVVRFRHNGHECTGRLLAGGQRPEVVLSITHSIRIDPTCLTLTQPPSMPSQFEEWHMVSYKHPRVVEPSNAFIAVIGRNGMKAVEASRSGEQERNQYIPAGKGTDDDVQAFRAVVRGFLDDLGYYLANPEDAWVEWAWNFQPSGVEFRDYLEQTTNVSRKPRTKTAEVN